MPPALHFPEMSEGLKIVIKPSCLHDEGSIKNPKSTRFSELPDTEHMEVLGGPCLREGMGTPPTRPRTYLCTSSIWPFLGGILL